MKRSKKRKLLRNISAPSLTIPSASSHRYIVIGRFHRNQTNAEEYALNLFRARYPELSLPEARGRMFRVDETSKPFAMSFHDAVTQARERGTAEALRSMVNGLDPYFNFDFAVSLDGEGPSIKFEFAGQKKELAGPMRQAMVEGELTDDILVHRRQASDGSMVGADGFQSTGMHFRGYVLASCALVEAFLNRCVLIDAHDGRTSAQLSELEVPCNVERRFELWLKHFAGQPLTVLTRTPEWDQYSELRRLRNSIMHPTQTPLGFALKDAARQLNLVRRGVGGLVNLLRSFQRLPPIPFAERLETAPECIFVSQVPRGTRRKATEAGAGR